MGIPIAIPEEIPWAEDTDIGRINIATMSTIRLTSLLWSRPQDKINRDKRTQTGSTDYSSGVFVGFGVGLPPADGLNESGIASIILFVDGRYKIALPALV